MTQQLPSMNMNDVPLERSRWQRLADRLSMLSAFSASAILHLVVLFIVFGNIVLLKLGSDETAGKLDVHQFESFDVRVEPEPVVKPEDMDEVIIKSPVVTPQEFRSETLPVVNPAFVEPGGALDTDRFEGPGISDVIALPTGRALSDVAVGGSNIPFVRVGFSGTYTEITRHATDLMVASAKGYRGVALFWLIDASISMRDDAEAIAQRVWDVFNGIRVADLPIRMGVVYFGEEPKLWVQLTDDVDHVMRALVAVPLDKSGRENVMRALDYCVDRFPTGSAIKRYICVLTDERGDDVERVEPTLSRLQRAGITVYVMGRESFLRREGGGHEQYFDEETRQMRVGVTDRGLCTPEPEQASVWPWWDYVPSGFGPYALSRIAVYTGGSFYMLRAKTVETRERPTPTAAKRVNLAEGYDPQMMQYYRPDLSSVRTYRTRLANGEVYKNLQRILDRWEPRRHWYRGYFERGELDTLIQRCENHLDFLEDLIKEFDRNLVPDARLQRMEDRRWVAHYDLARASASYAAWNFHQMRLRFILAKNERFPWRLLQLQHPRPEAISDERGIENRLRQRLFEHCQFVIDRHPGTPWAYAAQLMLDSPNSYLRSWSIGEYVPPDPTRPPPAGPPPI